MELRVVDGATVARVYPMSEAIAVMRQAFTDVSSGVVAQPPRQVLATAGGGAMAVMPAAIHRPDGAPAAFGLKTVSITPDNPARGLPAHHGLVAVFDPATGAPAAVVDAVAITAIRTAAASAVATDVLAAPTATALAIVGSGVQARSHISAMIEVREVSEVRVWSRDPEHARALCDWARRRHGLAALACNRVGAATAGADIICTTTASAEPILADEDVADGTHVNAVGASFAHTRELADKLVRRGHVFVDSRAAARNDAGDLLIPMRDGHFSFESVRGEIGEVLLGQRAGRTAGGREVTIFKSVGLAIQDLLSAVHVWERARAAGLGTAVALGGH